MNYPKWALTILLVALFIVSAYLFVSVAQSQEPPIQNEPDVVAAPSQLLFSYQGRLLDNNGNPLTSSGIPMIFQIFPQASGGSECWKESHTGGNTVVVQDGIFQVTLGQLTAINSACVTGDAYLQLTVNGQVLLPRERLTSVASAVTANSLSDGALVLGDLNVDGAVAASPGNNNLYLRNDNGPIRISSSQSVHVYIDSNNDAEGDAFTVSSNNDSHDPPLVQNLIRVKENGFVNTLGSFEVGGNNLFIGGAISDNVALRYDESRYLHLLPWGGSAYRWDAVCIGCASGAELDVRGDTFIRGNLNLSKSCLTASTSGTSTSGNEDKGCTGGNITTAAVIEANLQTPEELISDRIERFSEGDLLCWARERLEKCTKANDRAVQAVADTNGLPIVLGAELVRVHGKVEMNDILVTSEKPGHAMVNNNPSPGTVIGQALESFDGDSGLIKAMIRKW